LRQQTFAAILVIVGAALNCAEVRAQTHVTSDSPAPEEEEEPRPPSKLVADIKSYFTSPLHWNGTDWAYFGGALAAISVAHHYDDNVRHHFNFNRKNQGIGIDTKDAQDAIPAAAASIGTFLYANLAGDRNGRRESAAMLEAAGLSTVTAYVLKFAAGRKTPDQTLDANQWRKGGSSFPSVHVTAAFAIGTVLAESGSDEYRWPRRFLGYGVGIGTAYLRLEHNAHWLSDTVAGAALGAATARFVMHRRYGTDEDASSSIMVVPVEGGAMLTYSTHLQ
jgi:membrane-associated phospholipid phosphatase